METNDFYIKEPVGKLMMKFAIPTITALLVSSLYNIVDQIFIGHGVGYLGNAATNVVYPITLIANAIALLIGDGGAAYIGICQGRQDSDSVRKCVGSTLTLLTLSSVVLTVFLFLAGDRVLWLCGATDNNIVYTREYFTYILIGMPFFVLGTALSGVIRCDGNPRFAMVATLTGCVLNIILDPIAIFALDMGMKGAAIATVTGQITSASMCVWYLFHAKTYRLEKKDLRLNWKVLKKSLPLGMSIFLTQLSIMVNMTVMNNVLVTYGGLSKFGADIPLSVMGIVQKTYGIVVAVIVGLAAGTQPIVGYNYGAGQYDRVKKLYKTLILSEAVVGFLTTLLVELFPMSIIQLFGAEGQLYNEFAVLAFRIYFCTTILCCVQKGTAIFMQAVGNPLLSMGLSLARDFILCVPLILLLPKAMGIYGPIWATPLSDVISFAFVIAVMVYLKRNLAKLSVK